MTNRSSTCSTKRRAPLELIRTWSLTRWLFATTAIKPFWTGFQNPSHVSLIRGGFGREWNGIKILTSLEHPAPPHSFNLIIFCKHDRFLEATHFLVLPPNSSGEPYHCHSFLKSILGQFWTIGRVFHIPYNLLFHRQQEHLRVTVSTWREEHFRCLRDQEFERSRSRVALPAFQIKIISPILSCVSTICMNLVPQGYTRTQISLGAWDLPLHWYPEARAGRYGGGFGFLRTCFWSIFKELVV